MRGCKTGGRVKGTPNHATREIKILARRHAHAAVRELARLMTQSESEQTRITAIKEILDRGYGKVAPMMEESPRANKESKPPIHLEPFRILDANERSVEGPIKLGDFRRSI